MKLDLYANRTGSKNEVLIRIHKSNPLYPINYIPILHTKNSKYYLSFSSEFSWTYRDEEEGHQARDSTMETTTHANVVHQHNLRPIKCYDLFEGTQAADEWNKNCPNGVAYPIIVFSIHSIELISLPLVMNRLIKIPIPSQVTNVSGLNIIISENSQILVSIVV